MRLIVGLGNPGIEYLGTRHNAGVLLVDRLANSPEFIVDSSYGWRLRYGVYVFKTPKIVLIKSEKHFMNESGNVLREVLRFYELSTNNYELLVAHDDLDIKLGEYKVQKGRGPKEHNGVESVERALGTKDFWRIRIGIENRVQDSGFRVQGEEYVLQRFTAEEKKVLSVVLDEIVFEITHP